MLRSITGLVAVILLATGGVGLAPSASAQIPQSTRPEAPIVITMEKPADRQSYPLNSFVPVSAAALSAKPVAVMELWVDGKPIESKATNGFRNRYPAYFSWQPDSKGEHSISVRAVDETGGFADSPVVRVTATNPVHPMMLVETAGGSLKDIAGSLKVPLEGISALNPGVDPSQALAQGARVFAPVPTVAATGQPSPTASPIPAIAAQRAAPAAKTGITALKLAEGRLLADPDIDRVYYYVSLAGSDWRRVPADPGTFINPMGADDTARWERSSGRSLAGKGAFDLAGPLRDLKAFPEMDGSALAMETWGWRGGQLVFLGDFRQTISREFQLDPARFISTESELFVCTSGTGCLASDLSMGWRSDGAGVVRGSGNEKLKFLVKTSASGWDGSLVWQVATTPLSGAFDPAPPNLIASGANKGSSFEIDFALLHAQAPSGSTAAGSTKPAEPQTTAQTSQLDSSLDQLFNKGITGAGAGIAASAVEPSAMLSAAMKAINTTTYYVRATPMTGTVPVAAPSNTLSVKQSPPSEEKGVVILDPNEKLPSIFDIQVLEFNTFNPSSSGCALIVRNESVNPMAMVYQVGKVYCPAAFKGLGGKPWYELMVDFIASGVNWIARAYDSLKSGLVNLVAMGIPMCSTSDWCKGVLSAGLDIALAYAGLPPSLPSFAELTEMGEGYLLDYVSEQVGVDCSPGSICAEGVKAALAEKKQQALAGGSNEACLPEAEAHALGFEPMCLPPGVVGVPVEGSMPHPATMKLKIARKAGSPDVSDEQYLRYQLFLGAYGINNNYPEGKTIKVPVNYPRDSSTYALMCGMAPDEAPVVLDSTFSGMLFGHPAPGNPVTIMPSNMINPPPAEFMGPEALPVIIPRLEPGQSMEMTVPLSPVQPLWIPGHKEAIQKAGGAVCFDDWWRLYQGGQLSVFAEVGCSPQNQWTTCKLDSPTESKIEMEIPW